MSLLDCIKEMTRTAIESLYAGNCTVYEFVSIEGEETGITGQEEKKVLENIPCRISFKGISIASQTDTGTGIAQVIKLFLPPDIPIKPGSKISVTQNGVTTIYKNSGVPAVYSNHQEILLELFQEWA